LRHNVHEIENHK